MITQFKTSIRYKNLLNYLPDVNKIVNNRERKIMNSNQKHLLNIFQTLFRNAVKLTLRILSL